MTWLFLLVTFVVLIVPSLIERASAQFASWREERGILRFVHEQFKVTPDPWQEEALLAFQDPRPDKRLLSLQAAAGVGKSAVMSWMAWFFLGVQASVSLSGFGYDHPVGLVTGITEQNLKDNFWKELRIWQQRSPYLSAAFTHSAKRLYANDHRDTWFLSPRTWPRTGTAEQQGATLSGLHGRNVAVFVDESGAIPPTVMRAGKQAMFDGPRFGKLVQAGNPVSLTGMLHEAATREREDWVIVIVTNDPDDPRCSPRADKEAARKEIARYGRDNAWVRSYLLGQFPLTSLNTLLTIEEVLAAQRRELSPGSWEHMQRRLGVDVAYFGDDMSVLFARQGPNARVGVGNPHVMPGASTDQVAARILVSWDRWQPEMVFVDNGAMGPGVIDQLRVAGKTPTPVNFGGSPARPRYRNKRTECWMEMAQHIKEVAALADIPELVRELTEPTYTIENGLLALEPKDILKRRLGKSPDRADALACTYSLPDMPASVQHLLAGARGQAAIASSVPQRGRAVSDYDPMERG